MYRIPTSTLRTIQDALEKPYEICGIVLIDTQNPEILELESKDYGPQIKNGDRGSCRSTNVGLNFHTHPKMVWPWPSTEDMFNVLYQRNQKSVLWGSLIFTQWGIWEIYAPTKFSRDDLNKTKDWWDQNVSDKLYFALKLDKDPTVPPLKRILKPLQTYLNAWGDAYGDSGMEITLAAWEDIKGDYYLQTSLRTIDL